MYSYNKEAQPPSVRGRRPKQVAIGTVLARHELVAISGERVSVPDAEDIIHLQLRRFAGCPVCNMHLRSVVRRHDEIAAAGVREVVVFHSPAEELRDHTAELPFAVVADPEKQIYAELGAEAAPRALLDSRAWLPIVRAILLTIGTFVRGRYPLPPLNPHGGRLGLPADFLIASDGRVLACKYGSHVYDQWSVDELLAHARADNARSPITSNLVALAEPAR